MADTPRIKLRGFGGKPPSNPLLEHLRETYSPNPLDPREIVINDESAIEITPLGKDTARLNTIRALEKGTGAGSRTLDLVGKLADRFGTTLEGSAKPFGEGGLDKQQLIEFYRRHGWVSSEDDPADLSRAPRSTDKSKLPAVIDAASAASQLARFGADDSRPKGLRGGLGSLKRAPWMALAQMFWENLTPKQREVAEQYGKDAYGSFEDAWKAASAWSRRNRFPTGVEGGLQWAMDRLGFSDSEPEGEQPKKLLIMGCSAGKNPVECAVEASKLYKGGLWNVLNKNLGGADKVPEAIGGAGIDLHILSAKHGLIPADELIENYDQLLTKGRASEILGDKKMTQNISDVLGRYEPENVFVAAGKDYRELIKKTMNREYPTFQGARGIGDQRKQLKEWLARNVRPRSTDLERKAAGGFVDRPLYEDARMIG